MGVWRTRRRLRWPRSGPPRPFRDLPAARELGDLLADYVDEHAPEHHSRKIEDYFMVSRIEPGKLWLEPFMSGDREIGPVPVPSEVSRQCRVGWDISGVVAKTRKGWRLLEHLQGPGGRLLGLAQKDFAGSLAAPSDRAS